MKSSHDALDVALVEVDRLRYVLRREKIGQVRSTEEKSLIKATALSWFNNHRQEIQRRVGDDFISILDNHYKALFSATDRFILRSKYDNLLKNIRKELINLRGYTLTTGLTSTLKPTVDEPPKFDPLIADSRMRDILINRWSECVACLSAGAPLAATVMMGGLLEALLLARINKEEDKSNIFKAATSPKDKLNSKTLPLKDWTLRHFIDVAHELNWISRSAKDIGEVLRDYRNYVHPYKEFSHGIYLLEDDASLFWEISKGIARQIIKS